MTCPDCKSEVAPNERAAYGRCESCATGAARFRERVLELLSPEARAALARREGAVRRPAYKFKVTKS